MTSIEWTDATWNPIVGCSRVSAGCQRCYAERFVQRGLSPQHRGLTVMREHGPGWTGEVRLVESALSKPLSWRKPRRVFVNSLSDLFHEKISRRDVARVFAVMQACPHLTFQVLTKRPERMAAILSGACFDQEVAEAGEEMAALNGWCHAHEDAAWPLPNVWLGVTAEDQAAADERIPLLLETPAAVRFVSYEPALGPVDLLVAAFTGAESFSAMGGIDWVIVGGESGPKARPFDLWWARQVIAQCRAAAVPVFFKQAGARPVAPVSDPESDNYGERLPVRLRDRKGGDLAELPADLHVREFPTVRT